MNKSKIAAVLLLAASLTAACVTRWNAGTPVAFVSAPPSVAGAASSPGQVRGVEGPREGTSVVWATDWGGKTRVAGAFTEPVGFKSVVAQAPTESVAAQAPVVTSPLSAAGEPSLASSAIRMPVPFRTQKDGDRFQGSNCGPAALGMVLDAFGVARDNADLRFLTHTYQGTVGARTGTALQHIAHVAADLGLEPRGLYQRPDGSWGKEGYARWTVEDIRAEVLAGRPVVPLVKFRLLPGHEDSRFRADHYVVIHGVDGDQFLYHDPIYESPWEGGAKWMSAETLAAAMRPTLVPQQAVSFGAGRFASLPTTSR